MKAEHFLRVVRIGVVVIFITLLITQQAFSDRVSDSVIDIQTISKELNDIEKQIADLVTRQEKLLKDLEGLKVIARRN